MNNQATISLIIILTYFVDSSLCSEIGCFVDGECLDSISIGLTQQNTPNECLESCQETKTCHQFTFYADTSMCILFTDCVTLSDANCADCVSGDVTCEALVCNEPGKKKSEFQEGYLYSYWKTTQSKAPRQVERHVI